MHVATGVCAMMLLLAAGTACGSDVRSESAAQTKGNGGDTTAVPSKSTAIPSTDDTGHPGPKGCGSMVDVINEPSAHGHLTPEAAARAEVAFPVGGRVESRGKEVRVFVGDNVVLEFLMDRLADGSWLVHRTTRYGECTS